MQKVMGSGALGWLKPRPDTAPPQPVLFQHEVLGECQSLISYLPIDTVARDGNSHSFSPPESYHWIYCCCNNWDYRNTVCFHPIPPMILCSKPGAKEQLDTFGRVENQGPEGERNLPQAAQQKVYLSANSPPAQQVGNGVPMSGFAHPPTCPVGTVTAAAWGKSPGASASGRIHCL